VKKTFEDASGENVDGGRLTTIASENKKATSWSPSMSAGL
jgi:hypothetical protein